MFKIVSPVVLLALCVSAHAQNQKSLVPLAQSKNGEYTLRVLKAKWATMKEFSAWARPDMALTVWVDVVGPKEFVPSEEETKANRLSLASRLMDGRRKDGKSDSQLVSVGADRYGREKPYIPGESPAGQMVWRVQGADPRAKEILLEWEFLTPGSSPKKAEWPVALLDKENAALQISKNDSAETRRFSIMLPLNMVEPPTARELPPGNPKTVAGEGQNWQIWPAAVSRSRSRVISSSGATNGVSSPEVEQWLVNIPVAVSGNVGQQAWTFDLKDTKGYEWPAGSNAQYDLSAVKYWRPDGKMVGENEQVFELSGRFAKELAPDGKWALEGRRQSDRQRVANASFADVAVTTKEATGHPKPIGTWVVQEVRRFSAENPLPADWAPSGQSEGTAVKLALAVPDAQVWTRAYVRDVTVDNDTPIKPFNDAPMVIKRESSPNGASIVFQLILPPVADTAKTLAFRIDGGISEEASPKVTVEGLSFSLPQPKPEG